MQLSKLLRDQDCVAISVWHERMANNAVPLPGTQTWGTTQHLPPRDSKDAGPRTKTARAIWLQSHSSLERQTVSLNEVSGPLEQSSVLYELPLHRSPFLGLETVAIKQGQGRGANLPQGSPEARCRSLWPAVPRQEARGSERSTLWFQTTASTTWHRGGSPQAAPAADHKTSGQLHSQAHRPMGWGHWPAGTSRLCARPHRPGSNRACSLSRS